MWGWVTFHLMVSVGKYLTQHAVGKYLTQHAANTSVPVLCQKTLIGSLGPKVTHFEGIVTVERFTGT